MQQPQMFTKGPAVIAAGLGNSFIREINSVILILLSFLLWNVYVLYMCAFVCVCVCVFASCATSEHCVSMHVHTQRSSLLASTHSIHTIMYVHPGVHP